jgi:hypothetical protein
LIGLIIIAFVFLILFAPLVPLVPFALLAFCRVLFGEFAGTLYNIIPFAGDVYSRVGWIGILVYEFAFRFDFELTLGLDLLDDTRWCTSSPLPRDCMEASYELCGEHDVGLCCLPSSPSLIFLSAIWVDFDVWIRFKRLGSRPKFIHFL